MPKAVYNSWGPGKYDPVFHAAKRAGQALLIDEADALCGKRAEANDAHDRYATHR